MSEAEAWLERARTFDWVESVLICRIATMQRSEAQAILAKPLAFDTLSVAAALAFPK